MLCDIGKKWFSTFESCLYATRRVTTTLMSVASLNGNTVIIEKQLESTDHNHLGQVVTYPANLDAKRAIWIAREARPEHKKAIDWLNQVTRRIPYFI